MQTTTTDREAGQESIDVTLVRQNLGLKNFAYFMTSPEIKFIVWRQTLSILTLLKSVHKINNWKKHFQQFNCKIILFNKQKRTLWWFVSVPAKTVLDFIFSKPFSFQSNSFAFFWLQHCCQLNGVYIITSSAKKRFSAWSGFMKQLSVFRHFLKFVHELNKKSILQGRLYLPFVYQPIWLLPLNSFFSYVQIWSNLLIWVQLFTCRPFWHTIESKEWKTSWRLFELKNE